MSVTASQDGKAAGDGLLDHASLIKHPRLAFHDRGFGSGQDQMSVLARIHIREFSPRGSEGIGVSGKMFVPVIDRRIYGMIEGIVDYSHPRLGSLHDRHLTKIFSGGNPL
jgi:hypothetical protein